MAVSVMIRIDALDKAWTRKPISWQPKLFEASFTVARDKTNSGAVVLVNKKSMRANEPTKTRVEFLLWGFRHKAKRRIAFPSIANITTTADVKDSTTTRLRLLGARDIAKRIDLESGHWKPIFFPFVCLTENMQLLVDFRWRTSSGCGLSQPWSTFNHAAE